MKDYILIKYQSLFKKIIIFLVFNFYLISLQKKKFYNNIIKINFYINNNLNISLKKQFILNKLSNITGRNLTSVKSIFCSQKFNFGNQFMILNNVIFYCEILGCKKIILDKRYFWYIKNNIYDKKYRRYILTGDINNYINTPTIIDLSFSFWNRNPHYRIGLIKNEIIKNLPKVETNLDDIYIYIRSGYISLIFNRDYYQPPLCYYKKIIDNFKYKKIYIIAKDKTNKIINLLIKKYPNIIYKCNSLKKDIAYLTSAYNIVGVVSTFLYSSLQLNNNLKLFWHYGKYEFNFKTKNETIAYIMDLSKEYEKQRYFWKNNSTQLNLMIKDKCPNKFRIQK